METQLSPLPAAPNTPAQEPSPEQPTISRREVSWQATVAGMNARKQAEAQGGRREEVIALAHGAAVGGAIRTPGPSVLLGTLWAIDELVPFNPALVANSRPRDLTLLALTLREPERVLMACLSGDITELQRGMLETASSVSAEEAAQLDKWFSEEMEQLRTLTYTGGAKPATPGKPDGTPSGEIAGQP